MTAVATRAALLLVLVGLAGCIPAVPTRELADWDLEVDGVHERVHLPTHLGHGLDSRPAVYHLRTRVLVDDAWRGSYATLAVPIWRTQLELRVNGRRVPPLDEHLFDGRRVTAPHRFRIDPRDLESGALDLDFLVQNVWVQSSWLDTVPRLSQSTHGDRWTRLVRIFNLGSALVSLLSLCTLAFVFFLLRFLGRARRAEGADDAKNAEFAWLALGSAIYPAVQLGLFQPIFGRGDLALLFTSVWFTARASIQLLRLYLGRPPLPRWTFWAVCATVLLPFMADAFSHWGWAVVLVAFTFAVPVALYLMSRTASRHAQLETRWMLAGWIIVVCFAAADAAAAVGLGTPLRGIQMSCVGLFILILVQAYLLSRDHVRLVAAQHDLNDQLGHRVDEVEVLNEELRRKVGDRSRELGAALRRLRDEDAADLVPGAVLGERYRVTGRLGAGAMGEVYRVERLSDLRSLAAKVVRGHLRPETLERFTREAELAARVVHPNVVRVLDVDVTSDGELYLVMELVDGRSLEEERSRFGEHGFALPVLAQIAAALEAIHTAGVVHRDLKPSNVLVAPGPQIKLADFGIAGLLGTGTEPGGPRVTVGPGEPDSSEGALAATVDAPTMTPNPKLTQTGALLGTPLYMAPEVVSGASSIGPPADLFSFGLIAYQLLGGGPISRDGVVFRRDALRRFADLAPALPGALIETLERCLDADPTRRPGARELLGLLTPAAAAA